MANVLTIKQVNDLLTDIGARHLQINTVFEGRNYDTADNITYPLFQFYEESIRYPQTNGEYKTKEIVINCKVLDLLINGSKENSGDVSSDTGQIAGDIINEINEHPFYIRSNVSLVGDINLSALDEYSDDFVKGWEFTITLKLINNNSYCGLPFEDIAGYSAAGGVSTGYSYSVQFMPIAGGTFTGAITGTCGYFSCLNSTSLSGDSIYLSGVSLQNTFLSINSAISSATTAVQNGLNTYTGGTILAPKINISGGTLNNIYVTGTTSVSGLSATTISVYTGGTSFFKITPEGEIQIYGDNGTDSGVGIHQRSFALSTIIDIYNSDYTKLLFRATDNGSAGGVILANSTMDLNSYTNNVGIGIGAGAAKLRLKADSVGQDILAISPFASNSGVFFNNDSNNNCFFYLQPSAGTTTTLYLTSTGNTFFNGGKVGFGNTNPQEQVHISNGTLRINDVLATYGAGKIPVSDANGSISFSAVSSLVTGTAVQNSLNTYTGGTQSSPTVNVSALTINTLTASGNTSLQGATATTISATTFSADTITISKRSYNAINPINVSSATTINWATNNVFDFTLTAATTFSFSNALAGQTLIIAVHQPYTGTTGFNYSFSGATVYYPAGTTPTATTTTGKTDIYTFVSLSGNTVYGSALTNF